MGNSDYFISVIYPEYEIATGSPGATRVGSGTLDLGHTGFAYVNGETGEIRYFDYGRYSGTEGIIIEPLVSNDTGFTHVDLNALQQSGYPTGLGAALTETSGYNKNIQFNVFEVQDGSFENLNSIIEPDLNNPNGSYGEWTFFNTCHNFVQDMASNVGIDLDGLDGFSATPSGSAISLRNNSPTVLYNAEAGVHLEYSSDGNVLQGDITELINTGQLDISDAIILLQSTNDDYLKGAIIGGIQESNDNCFLAGTMISMWDGTEKPIEEITPDDWVVSTDKDGNLVPGRVTRTFQNQAKIILDYHGTMVTPGHAYLCTDGKFDGKYVPLIDILRSDGCVQKMDGTKIRAATNVPMGAPLDSFVWVVSGEKNAEGAITVAEKAKLRLGTRFITDDGRDICVWDIIANMGCLVTPEGLLARDNRSSDKRPFHWPFGMSIPKPEDYVLQRSAVTLDEIYRASEWEQHRPQLPAPNVGEAGPSLTHRPDVMKLAPVQPNIPLSMRDDPDSPGLSRQQRRAIEARKRKAEAKRKRKGVVH